MDRRTALSVVIALVAGEPMLAADFQPKALTRRVLLNPRGEEVLEVDFGAGAMMVKTIRLTAGAIHADLPVSELLAALGAKTGD
jgi:hypothetical protein